MPYIQSRGTDEAYDQLGQSARAFFDAWDAEHALGTERGAISFDALGIAIHRCVTAFRDKYPRADLDDVCRSVEMGLTNATDDWHEPVITDAHDG
jgi:hypothetical protein